MELRAFAERVFFGGRMQDKLFRPEHGSLIDENPGAARGWELPARQGLLVVEEDKRRRARMPRPAALVEERFRRRTLQIFANHELMALEMMAWALLAYPEASSEFRWGLLQVLFDEQRHLRMYCRRIEQMGGQFGEEGLNDHFFRAGPGLTTPLRWVCLLNLTFEQANLDHAPRFAQLFADAGDEASAAIMEKIFEDEIEHVGFGARQLQHHAREQGRASFALYCENLDASHSPSRARGPHMDLGARRRAGLDESFIEAMQRGDA